MIEAIHPQITPLVDERGWANGFTPASLQQYIHPPEVTEALAGMYASARADGQAAAGQKKITTVIKTVNPCNLDCSKPEEGWPTGYDCYEYVYPGWEVRPPVMPLETMRTTGSRMGEYAALHGLKKMIAILHGGEPLYIPKSEGGAPKYYREALPVLLGAIAKKSPGTEVELRMQTNGVLLRPEILDVLSEFNVGIGVSLDGPQAVHDQSRVIQHNGKRIGTFQLVQRGLEHLLKDEYRHLFRGFLSVIDVTSDPIAVYDTLRAHNPPKVDLLLPYATWDKPPHKLDTPYRTRKMMDVFAQARAMYSEQGFVPGIWPSELIRGERDTGVDIDTLVASLSKPFSANYRQVAPYADWLLRFYHRNVEDGEPLSVRMFDSVRSLSKGGPSFVEGIGPHAGLEIVVRTDGSIEGPDHKNASFAGATNLDMHIDTHSFATAVGELHPDGEEKKLALPCQGCDLAAICGGGHESTQHSEAKGFDNPSVYCLDLDELIRGITADTNSTQLGLVASVLHKRGQLPPGAIVPGLKRLRKHEERIWLDLTPHELERHIGSLGVGSLHVATDEEVERDNFAVGSLVPDDPRPATVEELLPYLAGPDTPASLCIEFAKRIPNIEEILEKAYRDDADPKFIVGDGPEYRLGFGKYAKLLQVIQNPANEPSTIIPSPRNITKHTHAGLAQRVGIHVEHFRDRRFPVNIRTDYAHRNLLIPDKGPRYHLTMLASSLSIAQQLFPRTFEYHVPTVRDLRRFYQERPEEAQAIPVLWVRMDPATKRLSYGSRDPSIHAVVSPVEIAGHEGSTRGFSGASQLTIMNGKWPRRAFQTM
jgi:uncharacterized protein